MRRGPGASNYFSGTAILIEHASLALHTSGTDNLAGLQIHLAEVWRYLTRGQGTRIACRHKLI